MRVSIPPRLPAKASGMSIREAWNPPWAAILMMMGIIRATVPVLLTKAPINAVASMTTMNVKVSLPFAIFISLLPTVCASPVRRMAPPTTNRPTIMATIVDENPARASVGVRIPVQSKVANAEMATTSERMRPQTKKATVRIRTINVTVIGCCCVLFECKMNLRTKVTLFLQTTRSHEFNLVICAYCPFVRYYGGIRVMFNYTNGNHNLGMDSTNVFYCYNVS